MADWHGYPQHPDAHPERPWWRRVTDPTWQQAMTIAIIQGRDPGLPRSWWERIDRKRTDVDAPGALAPSDPMWCEHIDDAHPLPPPEPRCGQVWVLASGRQALVVDVERAEAGWVVSAGAMRDRAVAVSWPPPGAVLVAGPGAPWAPMGEK